MSRQLSESAQECVRANDADKGPDAAVDRCNELTGEQLEWLRRAASGGSLRFVSLEIVEALVAVGSVVYGVAGTLQVTAEGRQFLRHHLGLYFGPLIKPNT